MWATQLPTAGAVSSILMPDAYVHAVSPTKAVPFTACVLSSWSCVDGAWLSRVLQWQLTMKALCVLEYSLKQQVHKYTI
jgi:hypothetical protein